MDKWFDRPTNQAPNAGRSGVFQGVSLVPVTDFVDANSYLVVGQFVVTNTNNAAIIVTLWRSAGSGTPQTIHVSPSIPVGASWSTATLFPAGIVLMPGQRLAASLSAVPTTQPVWDVVWAVPAQS